MVLKTKSNVNSKYTKMLIEIFWNEILVQVLSVTESNFEIRPNLISSEFILFIVYSLNSSFAYSNLNLEF